MRPLGEILDSLQLSYHAGPADFVLAFRGEILDHHLLLRADGAFIHAVCVLSRTPDPLPPGIAARMLEWNARQSVARLALADGQLLALADLPEQGATAGAVEEVVLSVVAAAEMFTRELLPEVLALARESRVDRHPSSVGVAARSPAVGATEPLLSHPAASLSAPADAAADDTDIDWDADDS